MLMRSAMPSRGTPVGRGFANIFKEGGTPELQVSVGSRLDNNDHSS